MYRQEWGPGAMQLYAAGDQRAVAELLRDRGDASEVGPAEVDWPLTEETPYRPRERPRVQIRVSGQWRDAVVLCRYQHDTERESLLAYVTFPEPDWPVTFARHYWATPATVHLVQNSAATGHRGQGAVSTADEASEDHA